MIYDFVLISSCRQTDNCYFCSNHESINNDIIITLLLNIKLSDEKYREEIKEV